MQLNTIHNTDCLELMKSLPDKCIDLIVTDPPYGIGFVSSFRNGNSKLKFDKIHNEDNLDWMPEFILQASRILKDDTAFYCFTRFDVYPEWYNEMKKYFAVILAGFLICLSAAR